MGDLLNSLTFNVDTVRGLQERSSEKNFQREFAHLQEQICIAANRGDRQLSKKIDYVSRYKIIEEMKSLGFEVITSTDGIAEYVTFGW